MYAELLFGALARYTVASDRMIRASGIPTKCTACCAAIATLSACGSASPTSSAAEITSLLLMNMRSSPASSILANQYRAASGSDPLIVFMKADIVS